jgi:hypothetical protein
MRKRSLAGALAGTAATLLAALLGWSLARARAEDAEGYARERTAQRRAVAASRRSVAAAQALPPARSTSTKSTCVTGLDTFAVAVERSLLPLPDVKARRVPAIKAISDAAMRAERVAELARPAPTLPRRMGLESGRPLVPLPRACDGVGFAELANPQAQGK